MCTCIKNLILCEIIKLCGSGGLRGARDDYCEEHSFRAATKRARLGGPVCGGEAARHLQDSTERLVAHRRHDRRAHHQQPHALRGTKSSQRGQRARRVRRVAGQAEAGLGARFQHRRAECQSLISLRNTYTECGYRCSSVYGTLAYRWFMYVHTKLRVHGIFSIESLVPSFHCCSWFVSVYSVALDLRLELCSLSYYSNPVHIIVLSMPYLSHSLLRNLLPVCTFYYEINVRGYTRIRHNIYLF